MVRLPKIIVEKKTQNRFIQLDDKNILDIEKVHEYVVYVQEFVCVALGCIKHLYDLRLLDVTTTSPLPFKTFPGILLWPGLVLP